MKGICFKESLFHATIEGRKTMTRRICKHQYWSHSEIVNVNRDQHYIDSDTTPRYKVGEVLYLKEPYRFDNRGHVFYKYSLKDRESDGWENKLFMPAWGARYFIRITAVRCEWLQEISDEDCIKEGCLEATDGFFFDGAEKNIRFGGRIFHQAYDTPQQAYAALIDKINGRGTWDSNPWVWVYEYELCQKPE